MKGKFCELHKAAFQEAESSTTGASRVQTFSPGSEEGIAGGGN